MCKSTSSKYSGYWIGSLVFFQWLSISLFTQQSLTSKPYIMDVQASFCAVAQGWVGTLSPQATRVRFGHTDGNDISLPKSGPILQRSLGTQYQRLHLRRLKALYRESACLPLVISPSWPTKVPTHVACSVFLQAIFIVNRDICHTFSYLLISLFNDENIVLPCLLTQNHLCTAQCLWCVP